MSRTPYVDLSLVMETGPATGEHIKSVYWNAGPRAGGMRLQAIQLNRYVAPVSRVRG